MLYGQMIHIREGTHRQYSKEYTQWGAHQNIPPVMPMIDDARERTEARPAQRQRLNGGH